MKYPEKQFNILTEVLKQFAVHTDIKNINPCTLHFMAYQQTSPGQTHNYLMCLPGGVLKKNHSLTETEKTKAIKLINHSFDFELYPNNCNDTHIETAIKKAIKTIGL
jgi:hypothetical protein